MRARLHVRAGQIGFFREGTHDLCDVRQTRQLLPATCVVLDSMARALASSDYDAVGEIELAENIDASGRVVDLVSVVPLDRSAIDRLASTDGVTGVASGSAVSGSTHVADRLTIGSQHTVMLRRHVRAFFQANRYLLSDIVRHVVQQVPDGGFVFDLYAGVGLFSVSAAVVRGARVTAVEGNKVAVADLRENASDSRADGTVTAVHESVESFVNRRGRELDRPEVVIVDPPRTGMSREALEGVIRLRAPRVVYVACDVATLARDARRLVDAGYTMTGIDAFDLFPNTPHVETVVILEI
jgi:23S rRNA (uracil1939-C5)-methyltransferase